MTFVFSAWYFVMLALVAGIAACLVVFFMMDKKDKVMIDKFIKDSQSEADVNNASSIEVENKTE